MLKSIKLTIINCKQCPSCVTKLTKGFGYATDYDCKLVKNTDGKFKTIKGYCEWTSEEPQDHEIPDWCPRKKGL
jgi:hypothetical protein